MSPAVKFQQPVDSQTRVAATPAATRDYTETDLRRGAALVVGSEQYGLTSRWMDEADERVRIPMLGQCDSLNVAAAATILLFEAARQRRADSPPAPAPAPLATRWSVLPPLPPLLLSLLLQAPLLAACS